MGNRTMALLAAFIVGAPAAAQTIDWTTATRIDITLSSFAFAPETVRLRAGQPVVLRLANPGDGGHNFAAREFFAASTIRASDRAFIRRGAVEVDGGASRDIALVPRAGTYRLRCTHTLHTAFGMSGTIVVE